MPPLFQSPSERYTITRKSIVRTTNDLPKCARAPVSIRQTGVGTECYNCLLDRSQPRTCLIATQPRGKCSLSRECLSGLALTSALRLKVPYMRSKAGYQYVARQCNAVTTLTPPVKCTAIEISQDAANLRDERSTTTTASRAFEAAFLFLFVRMRRV